jgi:hypothetical protein
MAIFRFWIRWILINTLSLTICLIIAGVIKELDAESHNYFSVDSPNVIDCAMSGLVLGVAQWLSLRKTIPGLSHKWILASLTALPISVFTTLVLTDLYALTHFNDYCPIKCLMENLIRHAFVGGTLGGAISGLIQQSALLQQNYQQQFKPASLTILSLTNLAGSAIGWTVGWGTACYVGYVLSNGYGAINYNDTERAMIQLSILGIVFGLVNGAIVGGGLIWTLRRSKFVFYID